jgi:hypothetical protein
MQIKTSIRAGNNIDPYANFNFRVNLGSGG